MSLGKFIYTEMPQGGIQVSYEDYNVEFYDGMDYEAIYTFDAANMEKLRSILAKDHKGPLESMIREEFGDCLEKKSFAMWLDENDIKYKFFNWIH